MRLLRTVDPVLGVAVALGLGSTALLRQGLPVGKPLNLVDLDGVEIRVVMDGFDALDPGTPVVVFESGFGSQVWVWDSILSSVAEFAPVLAYERSGIGQSEWDGLPSTPERVVTRLQRLLAELEIPPPYVLVGHSWGGSYGFVIRWNLKPRSCSPSSSTQRPNGVRPSCAPETCPRFTRVHARETKGTRGNARKILIGLRAG